MHFCTLHFICRPEDQDLKAAMKLLNSHQTDFDALEVSGRIFVLRLDILLTTFTLLPTISAILSTIRQSVEHLPKCWSVPPGSDLIHCFVKYCPTNQSFLSGLNAFYSPDLEPFPLSGAQDNSRELVCW